MDHSAVASAVAVLAHRADGIDNFKIDGVKGYPAGEANLARFADAVFARSDGKVTFDLDVTAAVRPGHVGLVRAGNVFVEDRYTNWRRYCPHATLRPLAARAAPRSRVFADGVPEPHPQRAPPAATTSLPAHYSAGSRRQDHFASVPVGPNHAPKIRI